ncbi:MAG: class I tRNA ligase family protein, partial [Methanobacteriota archaeon]
SELNSLVEECQKGYDVYNFFVPANKVRTFLWNVFAPHYVEMAKSRSDQGDGGALYALHECLRTMLKILAPVVPFITERIWSEMYGGSVHEETMPEPSHERKSGLSDASDELQQFNSDIWKTKKDQGMSLKSELEGIEIPEGLKPFESDLVMMHNLK